jgi:leucyl-tRNA synthetase
MLILIKLLNPVAPHITEEINEMCNLAGEELIRSAWPVHDEAALVKSTVEVALQVNGKVRGRILPRLTDEELAKLQHSGNALKEVIAQLDM